MFINGEYIDSVGDLELSATMLKIVLFPCNQSIFQQVDVTIGGSRIDKFSDRSFLSDDPPESKAFLHVIEVSLDSLKVACILGSLLTGLRLFQTATLAAFLRIYQAPQCGLIVEDPWDVDLIFLLGLLPVQTWQEIVVCHPIKLLRRE